MFIDIEVIKTMEAEAWDQAKAWVELNVPSNATDRDRAIYARGFANGIFFQAAKLRKAHKFGKIAYDKEYGIPAWVDAGLKLPG